MAKIRKISAPATFLNVTGSTLPRGSGQSQDLPDRGNQGFDANGFLQHGVNAVWLMVSGFVIHETFDHDDGYIIASVPQQE